MTSQIETPAALPSLEPLLKTSGKRTASVFCAELGDVEEEKSVRLRIAVKTRDEYSDVQTLPSALLAREGPVGPTRPGAAAGPKMITGAAGPQPQQKLIQNGPSTGAAPAPTPSSSTPAPSSALTTFRQQESLHTGSQSALTTALARRKAARQVQPDYHAPWKLVRVISGHLGWVRSVAVEPGNKWFVTGAGDRVIKVWDLASGELKLSLTGHISTVRGLAVSPRHPYLFSAGEDKMVKCWDLETNKVIRHYHGHLSGVYALDLHPTLDVLVTAGRDASARVWDMRTKAQIHVLAGHTGTVADVKCQESDPQVITGSMDSTVRLWDLAAGKTLTQLTHHKKSVRALAVHPTEFSFASGSAGGNNIKKWKCPEGAFVHNFSGHDAIINTLSVNAEGAFFSGADNGTITWWDYKTGIPFQHMDDIPQPGSLDAEAGIFCSTFDQTGTRLITGGADKTIKVYAEQTQ
ncbi:WD40 repeat-like protein [Ceratobasidium sp. AG-I]|nr:WD40 repeat-like protein [Ceratobasidium sp. AG-I]